jgi:hypothetical protein
MKDEMIFGLFIVIMAMLGSYTARCIEELVRVIFE